MKRILILILLLIPFQAAAQFKEQQQWGTVQTSSSTPNAQIIYLANVSSLDDIKGVRINFISTVAFNAPMTIAISNGVFNTPAKAVYQISPSGISPIIGQECIVNSICTIIYDGNEFVVLTNYATSGYHQVGTNLFYYVSNGGSDSNPGTITQPWATLQHASDVLSTFQLNGHVITVVVSPGTFTRVNLLPTSGNGYIYILGSPSTPGLTNIVSVNGPAVQGSGGTWTMDGFKISGTGVDSSSQLTGCVIIGSGLVNFFHITLGACDGWGFHVQNPGSVLGIGGNINISGNISSRGGPGTVLGAVDGAGVISGSPSQNRPVFNITSSVSANYWVYATSLAVLNIPDNGIQNASNFNGRKYIVQLNAVANSGTGDVNHWPGGVPGQIFTGGQVN